MYMIYIWLAVICIGLIIEALQAGTLVSIWFSAGAVVPFFMSFWRTDAVWYITLQIVVFGIITSLLLIFIRKIAKKLLFKNNQSTTNLDSLVNKKVKITQINGDVVYVKINDVEYRAVGVDADELKVGEVVVIKKLEGNKVVVDKN
ncbi:MAG: NfeD family protein [Clostridia bacterium]|nr:NfeD family protein [Clostridia bacterium]